MWECCRGDTEVYGKATEKGCTSGLRAGRESPPWTTDTYIYIYIYIYRCIRTCRLYTHIYIYICICVWRETDIDLSAIDVYLLIFIYFHVQNQNVDVYNICISTIHTYIYIYICISLSTNTRHMCLHSCRDLFSFNSINLLFSCVLKTKSGAREVLQACKTPTRRIMRCSSACARFVIILWP